jgi:hypothetical protein
MATGSAGGSAALSGRPAGTTPLHDFNRENLPEQAGGLDVIESGDGQLVRHPHPEPVGGREHADGLGI